MEIDQTVILILACRRRLLGCVINRGQKPNANDTLMAPSVAQADAILASFAGVDSELAVA